MEGLDQFLIVIFSICFLGVAIVYAMKCIAAFVAEGKRRSPTANFQHQNEH